MNDELDTYLKQNELLAPVVGVRIYPDSLPTKYSLPSIVYQRVSNPRTDTHTSHSYNPRYQFSVWGKTSDNAYSVAMLLDVALHGLKQGSIQSSFVDDDRSQREMDTGLYRVILDVIFFSRSS